MVVVAVVAVVLALIDCLKKTGTAIPKFARISSKDDDEPFNKTSMEDTQKVQDAVPSGYPIISDSQLKTGTMEIFLSEMEREKPTRFSPQQLARFTSDFSMLLGSGGFGVVYKGEFPNGLPVAVKVINSNSEKKVAEQFMAEVASIGRTYHINLVRLYGFCFDPTMRALVYEYVENGSLDRFLFGENKATNDQWGKLEEIAVGTAKGIAYLHEECRQRIIHYDIKPANVLLDAVLSPKLADFGLAKLCNRDSTQVPVTGFRGTPGYAAPELWKPYPVTCKCDVYSFGMLLFEMVGRRRNHDASLSETRQWLPRWTWEMFEKNELPEMLSLCGIKETNIEKAGRMCMVAMWCVQYLPEARPTMGKVVKMLEGETEIPPPPYPFQRSMPNLVSSSGNSEDTDPSESTRETSEPSYAAPGEGVLEIEIVS